MRRIRVALVLAALVALGTTLPVKAQTPPAAPEGAIRHFAVFYNTTISGLQNPQPVDAATYAVYNDVLEFATTTPDGVRRIVLGVPLESVRSYFEYNYTH